MPIVPCMAVAATTKGEEGADKPNDTVGAVRNSIKSGVDWGVTGYVHNSGRMPGAPCVAAAAMTKGEGC
jgi:hypothetical protein